MGAPTSVGPAVGPSAPAAFEPAPAAPAPVAFSTLTEGAPAPPVAPLSAETTVTPPVATAPAVTSDPFAVSTPRPSDPFAGPVEPGTTAAAAAAADPFGLPPGDDPLAPPPLPPDPFGVSTPVAAVVDTPTGADPTGADAPIDAPATTVLSDPFAAPAPGSGGFGTDGSSGFGVTVLDAIVVDDPLAEAAAAASLPVLDEPAPSGGSLPDATAAPVDVVAPDPHEPEPDVGVAPIAWSAPSVDAPPEATTITPEVTPRFERAGAQWEIGGIFPATAMADDGTLALRRADARWALTDLRAPGDFIIEAAVDFRAGAGFGLVFRASVDPGERISGYSFDLDAVASGGGYLVRLWDGSRQHWRPLAHAAVTDPAQLYGRHVVRVTVRSDQLTVQVDDDPVLEIPGLSRACVDGGREPCRGDRVGIQAWSTTEVTVESFRVAAL